MRMTRGDSDRKSFVRRDLNGQIITAMPYAIFFTVKNSYDDENLILQKRLGEGIEFDGQTYHLSISPEDTESLAYGNYVFDIEVIQDSEQTYKRTIKKGQFILEGESTWKINEGNN